MAEEQGSKVIVREGGMGGWELRAKHGGERVKRHFIFHIGDDSLAGGGRVGSG